MKFVYSFQHTNEDESAVKELINLFPEFSKESNISYYITLYVNRRNLKVNFYYGFGKLNTINIDKIE